MAYDDEAPIIVTGPNRSGTTWMQWFLSQHPRIHIHGQTPNIPWHSFWNVSQTMVEQGDWARRANLQVGYEIAHYAGSDRQRSRDIFCRALREFLSGFGPFKPRWGVKWLDMCAEPGAVDQVEWLWPQTRWIVCIRDPFVTISSTKNTFVPDVDGPALAQIWVRTCQFVESHHGDRVALFQVDLLARQTETGRREAIERVLDCVGEEPTEETDRFVSQWPLVHKVRADDERTFVLSDEEKFRLLRDVPLLGFYLRKMGYDVPRQKEEVT